MTYTEQTVREYISKINELECQLAWLIADNEEKNRCLEQAIHETELAENELMTAETIIKSQRVLLREKYASGVIFPIDKVLEAIGIAAGRVIYVPTPAVFEQSEQETQGIEQTTRD